MIPWKKVRRNKEYKNSHLTHIKIIFFCKISLFIRFTKKNFNQNQRKISTEADFLNPIASITNGNPENLETLIVPMLNCNSSWSQINYKIVFISLLSTRQSFGFIDYYFL